MSEAEMPEFSQKKMEKLFSWGSWHAKMDRLCKAKNSTRRICSWEDPEGI